VGIALIDYKVSAPRARRSFGSSGQAPGTGDKMPALLGSELRPAPEPDAAIATPISTGQVHDAFQVVGLRK
jgi:hypothetical protein